ncbi:MULTISPECIES: MucB/RseB C-terminal domain-containing protein [unclassified Idiomarina]|jgi:sigma-E factor negative regulatory protein RseB|uniref:MucB/RseB C-terminal domain-containing protein n=1 Tax=unclassified Idiomarina TaxID=2614829 RepID=UPI0025C2640D|nr:MULTISPECIES: MucB/RseB C-terminal domain-containing protein [unclassified Idiomarina]MEC7642847.1 MucB/RseB C-terminal domain-containing protein [Pseudomonadota bacterium]MEC9319962.1 MucB/RseB C-terminal domain-containing protein [Pseudomonadota bacterium]NQZ03896.1 MucB/RseB C-terminal domain-containing protein [Idiomarina sp.]|tara:strand:+ start:1744 stop:2709 length:966 start_codon:yes stop_codon:yes gene_type:complete
MKPGVWLVSLALALLLASPAFAQQETEQVAQSDGERWYNFMSDALNEQNFEASLVYVLGDRIEPYHWLHAVEASGEQLELIVQMNGPGFRVLRIGDKVSHFHPAARDYSLRARSINYLIPPAFSQKFELIKDYYRVVAVGGARVLDRKAQHIRLISKHDNRFGFSVWVDRDSGMPLKMMMINEEGVPIEQVQMTSLALRQDPSPLLEELKRLSMPPLIQMSTLNQQMQSNVRPTWQPEGFKLVEQKHHQLAVDDTPVDHYLFTDGLTEYSVYIAPRAAEQAGSMSVIGSQNLYTEPRNDVIITVVGQIPIQTAKRIVAEVQ